MEVFVSWCSFVGAWLLFAGPIYQAAIELRKEQFEHEHFKETAKNLERPQKTSAWWWLVPPVKIILERKRDKEYRQAFMHALPEEDVEAIIAFFDKATGWLFVAAGGFLLAVGETYNLVEELDLEKWVFWAASVVLALLCVANTAYRTWRTEKIKAGNHH